MDRFALFPMTADHSRAHRNRWYAKNTTFRTNECVPFHYNGSDWARLPQAYSEQNVNLPMRSWAVGWVVMLGSKREEENTTSGDEATKGKGTRHQKMGTKEMGRFGHFTRKRPTERAHLNQIKAKSNLFPRALNRFWYYRPMHLCPIFFFFSRKA